MFRLGGLGEDEIERTGAKGIEEGEREQESEGQEELMLGSKCYLIITLGIEFLANNIEFIKFIELHT